MQFSKSQRQCLYSILLHIIQIELIRNSLEMQTLFLSYTVEVEICCHNQLHSGQMVLMFLRWGS